LSRANDRSQPEREPQERDESSDKITIVPPFDVEEFAHASESKIRSARVSSPDDQLTVARIAALYADGDYERALEIAEAALAVVPLHVEARAWAARCKDALEQHYLATVGSLTSVPSIAVSERELRVFGLDHSAGFIVAQIDGITNVETILDVCGMPRLTALRILSDLAARGIVVCQ